jgi:hypothetical protein
MRKQLLFVPLGWLLLWWCADTLAQPAGTLKGVSLSPRSSQPADFTDFFQKAQETGDVVMWAGDWIEMSDTSGGGPTVVAMLASTYHYVPLIEAQFFTQSTGELLRPLDDSTRQVYRSSAAAFAGKYRPEYLGFGIEVNTLYEKSPTDFQAFVQFFDEVYDTVKAKSPTTKVFPVFQLEKMKGLNGGLFGGTNDTANAQWSLLDRFPRSDLVVFTTYPSLVFKNPSDIPANYYTEIKSRTQKPVAFTEIGWHSDASPMGWESSDAEQAEFVRTFLALTKELDKELTIWSFMYDQDTIEPFNSMGLRRRTDGTAKQAWDEWVAALTLAEREPATIPVELSLSQNYPNPFNSSTTICFSIQEQTEVSLTIFDMLGREVKRLADGELNAGEHAVVYDASGSASGVYFYRLQAGPSSESKKFVLLR